MDIIGLLIVVVIVCFILWMIKHYISNPVLRNWLLIGVVVLVGLWLLFGVLGVGNLGSVRLD